jgi:hypothetical protein
MSSVWRRKIALSAAILLAPLAMAQAQQQPQQQQPQQQSTWDQLPAMQLERQFKGPLQDTVIQRWRDPADGSICYVYLPITASHSPPTPSGFVQYGANTIGSISCTAMPTPAARPAPKSPSPQAR